MRGLRKVSNSDTGSRRKASCMEAQTFKPPGSLEYVQMLTEKILLVQELPWII
jgi:hypothetical protein